jgi:hypothetical protein
MHGAVRQRRTKDLPAIATDQLVQIYKALLENGSGREGP